jgi:DNA-binding transcriptional ArsR family regulator
VTAPAPVCSRHVAAGVVPDPGATSAAPAWWGDADWLAEVAAALDAPTGVELLRQHHVARDTALKVAEGHAAHADFRTGRDCRPTNARLVEVCRMSLSTVQRARRVLEGLHLVRRLIQGRSMMTRAERLQAWRRGSSHRAIAATFALCSRKHRPARSAVARLGLVRSALVVQRVSHLSSTHSSDQAETRNGAARRAHNENRRRGPAGGADPRTRRLVEDVRRRLGWLRDVPAWRLALALRRFAVAGWTARDVDLAVVDALAARGWRRPAVLTQPAAYLALLLRELDPAERPSVLDDALLAAEAAQLAYERRLVFGVPCPHGRPAGNEPSPLRGHLACPECRREDGR